MGKTNVDILFYPVLRFVLSTNRMEDEMKEITAYITSDGKVHDDFQKALKHVDDRYGNELCKISRDLAKLDSKYANINDYLDSNIETLRHLIALRDDINVETNEEE